MDTNNEINGIIKSPFFKDFLLLIIYIILMFVATLPFLFIFTKKWPVEYALSDRLFTLLKKTVIPISLNNNRLDEKDPMTLLKTTINMADEDNHDPLKDNIDKSIIISEA